MPMNGECMCGAVQVEIQDQPPDKMSSLYCHCTNCKKQSGAAGTYVMVIPDNDVKITGETKIYEDRKTDSGKLLLRFFCGNCGSPVHSVSQLAPGVKFVKMGLFDEIPKPRAEIYVKNRQSWECAVEGVAGQVPGAT